VHAFVTPVLLRIARRDALDRNAESQSPHRELAHAEQSRRAARHIRTARYQES